MMYYDEVAPMTEDDIKRVKEILFEDAIQDDRYNTEREDDSQQGNWWETVD